MEPMFVFEEYYPSSSEENQLESVTNPLLQQPNIFAQLQDPAPRTITEHEDIKYEILEHGTKRRSDMLTSSDGYRYTKLRPNKSGQKMYWRCAVRSAKCFCKATNAQDGDELKHGPRSHSHPPDFELASKTIGYRSSG